MVVIPSWKCALLVVSLGLSLTLAQTNGFCNLVWNDEFDGPTLDTSKWQKEANCHGGGNNELQCYTARDKNVYMEDGKLVLKAYKERYTGTQAGCTDTQGCTNTKDFTSGRVRSALAPGGSFLRGRMEIRAKLASGSHLWPAIWMLPTDWNYGGWAASGEIDIMELRGNYPKVISGTLHHGGEWPNNKWTSSGDKTFADDLSQDYHVYALEWTETQMKWFMDSTNFYTLDMNTWWNTSINNNPYTARGQPWDRKFHFVLNLAIGGGYFGGYPALTDADVAAWKVTDMRVDYVRAWTLGGDCTKAVPTAATSANVPPPTSGDAPPTVLPPVISASKTDLPTDQTGDNAESQGDDLQNAAKITIIISAVVGGSVLLLGIAGAVVAVLFIRKARRHLAVSGSSLSPSSSQTQLTKW